MKLNCVAQPYLITLSDWPAEIFFFFVNMGGQRYATAISLHWELKIKYSFGACVVLIRVDYGSNMFNNHKSWYDTKYTDQ